MDWIARPLFGMTCAHQLSRTLLGAALFAAVACHGPGQRSPARKMLEALRHGRQASACYRGDNGNGASVTEPWLTAMIQGLFGFEDNDKGTIAWRRCMVRVFTTLTPEEAKVARRTILEQLVAGLEGKRRNNGAALHILYELFTLTPEPTSVGSIAPRAAHLIETQQRGKRSARLREAHEHWRTILALMMGSWEGQALTERRILAIEDEETLLHFARFLSTDGMRALCKRRVVQLRLRRGRFPELIPLEEDVIDAVLTQGHYTPPLSRFPPMTLEIDPGSLPQSAALHPERHFHYYVASPEIAGKLEDGIDLDGSMAIRLSGIELPIRLCRGQEALDPTPCIPRDLLKPTTGRWSGSRYLLSRRLSVADVLEVLAAGNVAVAFELSGKHLALGEVPVTLRPPPHMRFEGDRGDDGPDLRVEIAQPTEDLVLFAVATRTNRHFALVHAEGAESYRVITQGGQGLVGPAGAPGSPGRDGRDGRDAVCPNETGENGEDGEDGGSGGNGGMGGRGGNGGTIEVTMSCDQEVCRRLRSQLGIVLQSRGGPGGAGGPGGPGGPGGKGGSGGASTSCDDTADDDSESLGDAIALTLLNSVVSAVFSAVFPSDGADGQQGPHGPRGPTGPPGLPGQVVGAQAAPAAEPAPSAELQKLFVLRSRLIGDVDSRLADLFSEAVLEAVSEQGAFDALGYADIDALLDLERQRDLVGCDDVTCVAEIAGGFGVDYLLRSSIGRVGDQVVAHVSLMASDGARVLARRDRAYDSEQALLDGAAPLVMAVLEDL